MGFLDATGITTLVTKLKNYFALKTDLNRKQDLLVSGVNVKTINGSSILGNGNITINDIMAYEIRAQSATMPASDKGYCYRIWLTSADGKNYVPINTSTSTNATTTRELNTRPIDPFGQIVYFDYSGSVNAGSNLYITNLWVQNNLRIGYSYVKTLSSYKPVYIKCTPQADGSAVMVDIVQELPSSNDGKIYIFLGVAYSTTHMELYLNHPVYYHDGSGIRLWRGGFGSAPETITFANLCSDTWHYNTIGSLADTSAGIYYMPDRGHYTTGDITYNDIRTAIQNLEPATFINRLKSISPFDIGSQNGTARFDLYIEPGVQNDVDGSHPATVEYLHVLMTDTDATTYQYMVEFDYYRYTAIDNDFGGWEYDAKYGEVIPVANGGTGATTASGARTNLDVPGLTVANTFSADQTISASFEYLKSLNIDVDGTPPTGSTTWGSSRIVFRDKDNANIGQLAPIHSTNDRVGMLLYAQRGSGGGTNGVYLTINNDDTPYVSFSGTGTLAAWQTALGLNTWTTVTLANFATAASGWTFTTASCTIQYNAAIDAVRVNLRIAPSSNQTAGQKTLFTVKEAYRPKTMASSVPSLTSNAQAGQIYTTGGFATNIVAINSGTSLYFQGTYFIGA